MGALEPQSNRQLYNNTVIGALAVDGWLLHLVQRGRAWAGCGPAQAPPRCTRCNSPPVNGQCANFILYDVALPLHSEGLINQSILFVSDQRRSI